jgi:hypothetical protein
MARDWRAPKSRLERHCGGAADPYRLHLERRTDHPAAPLLRVALVTAPSDMTDAQLQDEFVQALAADHADPAVLDALEDEALIVC